MAACQDCNLMIYYPEVQLGENSSEGLVSFVENLHLSRWNHMYTPTISSPNHHLQTVLSTALNSAAATTR